MIAQGQQFQAILSNSSSFYSYAKIKGSQASHIDYMRKRFETSRSFNVSCSTQMQRFLISIRYSIKAI